MNADTGASIAPYSIHAGDVERDREIVLGIWRGNLGRAERLPAKYDWFYRQCPWGAPLLFLLRHDPSGEWVGAAAIGLRRLQWRGRELRAGILVDLAVASGHRTLGPALSLQRALFARAGDDFDVVYGFPNLKAVALVKRVGYVHLADMARLSRVLRHAPYLARHLPAPLARLAGWGVDTWDRLRHGRGERSGPAHEWLDAADPRLSAPAVPDKDGSELSSPRDLATLQWRFDRAPGARPRYLRLSDAVGRTQAWFVCEVDGTSVRVQDLGGTVDAMAIATLIRAARALGAASVSVELTVGDAVWSRAGFVERARRPIYGRWRETLGDRPLPAQIHFTSADEDE